MDKINIRIFPPHSEIQRRVITHLAERKTKTKTIWLACGTKFGKSIASAGAMCYAMPRFPNSLWRLVTPIFRQTKIGRRYVLNMLPPPPFIKENKAEASIYIPSRNIELQLWSGQNPEDLEGEGVLGQINDECAKMKEQVLTSSRTTWTLTRAQVLNISTPRGRNFFYKGCMRAKEEMERAKFEKREPEEIFLTAPTSDNPHVPRESIDEAKRLLPDRLFRQYYLAEFIEDGAVFPALKIDKEIWKNEYMKTGQDEIWIHPDHSNYNIVAGADWAKTQDYTVLTCWDYTKRPFRCVGFYRMQGRRYTDQLITIVKFLRRFKSCDMLYHDKTGLGSVIDDLLSQIPDLVFHGIVFSNASKAEMVNDLIAAIEMEEVIFPWWHELIKEFDSYEVETNALGRMMYQASEGSHDDIVTSCFLGYAACKEYSGKDFDIRFLEELPAESVVGTWENYLSDCFDTDFD